MWTVENKGISQEPKSLLIKKLISVLIFSSFFLFFLVLPIFSIFCVNFFCSVQNVVVDVNLNKRMLYLMLIIRCCISSLFLKSHYDIWVSHKLKVQLKVQFINWLILVGDPNNSTASFLLMVFWCQIFFNRYSFILCLQTFWFSFTFSIKKSSCFNPFYFAPYIAWHK